MEHTSTNKNRLKEITERIEKGIAEVFTSGKYAEYLRVMSRFHNYSTNNRLLIWSQRPDAQLLAGYQGWQTKFGRHVVKGAKGITILAPTPYKKKIEEEKRDPETNLPMLDENGNVIIEEKEVKIPMFKPVSVFDVSDTEGKPLPTLAETLVGDVKNYEIFMEALRRSSPVPVFLEPMQADMDGYFSLTGQDIHIRDGMSEVQTVCAVIHEITHAKLHNSDAGEERSRDTEEIEAESVAFTVCAYYGIETGANSFGYLANYTQGKSIAELKTSLDLIGKTADELINDIDRNYGEILKERGIVNIDMEQQFLENPADAMAIYQLKPDAPQELLYARFAELNAPSDRANYNLIYTREQPSGGNLEDIFYEFNENRPSDFTGHSLSVGDIVALKQDGVVSYHYCDSFGFRELPDFGKKDPVGKAERKPSVLGKLKKPPEQPKKTKAPKKTKEKTR